MSEAGAGPVRIERIAAGGDGVGRLADGRVVFVPRTAPGDLVQLTAVDLRARFARARVNRVLEPGPDRVEALCTHYSADHCGGCQLQHLSSAAQLAARRRIVGDALRRIARLPLEDPELEPAPRQWNYRNRITLTWSGVGNRLGFHPYGRAGDVFELRRCEIAAAPLNEALPGLRRTRAGFPPDLERVTLRTESPAGRTARLDVVLHGPTAPPGDPLHSLLVAQGGDRPVGVWWRPRPGDTRLLQGDAGGGPAASFSQVDLERGDRIRRFALELVGGLDGRHAWDLYAGRGEASTLLADAGATVESVELDRVAVDAARASDARAAIIRHQGRVETVAGRLAPPWAVYANPPREGLGPAVVAALRRAAPRRIAYVSCDPATFARDLRALGPQYDIESLRAFDLFPQTAHVETVVLLAHR